MLATTLPVSRSKTFPLPRSALRENEFLAHRDDVQRRGHRIRFPDQTPRSSRRAARRSGPSSLPSRRCSRRCRCSRRASSACISTSGSSRSSTRSPRRFPGIQAGREAVVLGRQAPPLLLARGVAERRPSSRTSRRARRCRNRCRRCHTSEKSFSQSSLPVFTVPGPDPRAMVLRVIRNRVRVDPAVHLAPVLGRLRFALEGERLLRALRRVLAPSPTRRSRCSHAPPAETAGSSPASR